MTRLLTILTALTFCLPAVAGEVTDDVSAGYVKLVTRSFEPDFAACEENFALNFCYVNHRDQIPAQPEFLLEKKRIERSFHIDRDTKIDIYFVVDATGYKAMALFGSRGAATEVAKRYIRLAMATLTPGELNVQLFAAVQE